METRAHKLKKASTFPFEDLPVEIELEVMSYLDINDLVRCTRVSKKIRALCQDQSLWQKINLSWKKIPISFVQFVLDKNCKSLILHGSAVIGRGLNLTKNSQLRHLDLRQCKIKAKPMVDLLFSCHNLERLSMDILYLEPNTVKIICQQNGKTLQKLELKYWDSRTPIYFDPVRTIPEIFKYCPELTEVNLGLGGIHKRFECALSIADFL